MQRDQLPHAPVELLTRSLGPMDPLGPAFRVLRLQVDPATSACPPPFKWVLEK